MHLNTVLLLEKNKRGAIIFLLMRSRPGRKRSLPWEKTFFGSFKCLDCGHKTPTQKGFYSHYYSVHWATRTPVPSTVIPLPTRSPIQNENDGEKPGGVMGFFQTLPAIIDALNRRNRRDSGPKTGW